MCKTSNMITTYMNTSMTSLIHSFYISYNFLFTVCVIYYIDKVVNNPFHIYYADCNSNVWYNVFTTSIVTDICVTNGHTYFTYTCLHSTENTNPIILCINKRYIWLILCLRVFRVAFRRRGSSKPNIFPIYTITYSLSLFLERPFLIFVFLLLF